MSTIQNNSALFFNTNPEVKTNKQEDKSQSSLPREVVGIAAGAGAGYCVGKGANLALKPYYKNLMSSFDTFHSTNSGIMIQEAERMANEANLYQKGFKGIKIVDVSSKDKITQATKAFTAEIVKSIKEGSVFKKIKFGSFCILKKITDFSYTLIGKNVKFELKTKANNCVKYGGYNPICNNVISGSTSSLLHEVGHAINKNKNFLTRIPSRLAMMSTVLLTPLAILTAMFHKKDKNQNPENKSFLTKTMDFIKDNTGLTIAGLSLPLLAEEGMASLRAVKFANKSTLMTEAVKKAHSKLLLMAFGTYAAGAVVLTAMAKTAVWVKDKITNGE